MKRYMLLSKELNKERTLQRLQKPMSKETFYAIP